MKVLILTIAFAALSATQPFEDPENHPAKDEPEWTLVSDGDGDVDHINAKAYYNEPERLIFNNYNATSDVIFRLFTRRNPTEPQIIYFKNKTSLTNSHFNRNHPTRFIIHGFLNTGNSKINKVITATYLNRSEFNVITVDWGVGSDLLPPCYLVASNRTYETGQHVARFIDWIHASTGISFGSIFVVGHSLGGHIAGIAGKHVKRGRLQAIFALDPAKPGFSIDRPATRIASTDANYVEVIHTHTKTFGIGEPIGTADFYPNWGYTQRFFTIKLLKLSRSHSRAYKYFAESIKTPGSFVGIKCANYAEIVNKNCTLKGSTSIMGEKLSGFNRGIYFVNINASLKLKACGILVILLSKISLLNITNF